MSLYVLDTDHIILLRYGHDEVVARMNQKNESELAVSIVSIEEMLRGWFTQVRKASDAVKLSRAYDGLAEVVGLSKSMHVLSLRPVAAELYFDLRKRLPRIGKNDLAIAAIALDADATLVTRNRHDFEQVAGLRLEDWSKP